MPLVVPDVAEATILNFILGKTTAPANQILKLFKNAYTPSESTTLSDFTESTEAGYSPVTLNANNWTVSSNSGVTTASYAEQTFVFSQGATVYGYYIITSETNPQLLWAERFTSAPFVLPNSGGSIAITPKIGAE